MELSYRQDFQQDEQSAWFDKEELQRVFNPKNSVLSFGLGLSWNMGLLFGHLSLPGILLERVQRHATKFILKTEDDYEVRISKLNLLSLEQRRFLFDVLFFL